MKREVEVIRYIEQVVVGSHYKGYLALGGTKLEYEIRFAVLISKLDDITPIPEPEEMANICQITVKKKEESIELTIDEYILFFMLIASFAVEFYNDPKTRILDSFSISVSITSTRSFNFSEKICKILSDPKFGCEFDG